MVTAATISNDPCPKFIVRVVQNVSVSPIAIRAYVAPTQTPAKISWSANVTVAEPAKSVLGQLQLDRALGLHVLEHRQVLLRDRVMPFWREQYTALTPWKSLMPSIAFTIALGSVELASRMPSKSTLAASYAFATVSDIDSCGRAGSGPHHRSAEYFAL